MAAGYLERDTVVVLQQLYAIEDAITAVSILGVGGRKSVFHPTAVGNNRIYVAKPSYCFKEGVEGRLVRHEVKRKGVKVSSGVRCSSNEEKTLKKTEKNRRHLKKIRSRVCW